MNLTAIARHVAEFSPDAKDVQCREAWPGMWACIATFNGFPRSVMFDATGIYGTAVYSITTAPAKSEIVLASEIAKELRK